MRLRTSLRALRGRLDHPLPWVGLLAFGLIFAGLKLWIMLRSGYTGPWTWISGFLTPFLMAAVYSLLSPLPWLWTGDGRPRAGAIRGILQGVLVHSAAVAAIWGLDYGLLCAAGARSLVGHIQASFVVNQIVGASLMTLIGGFIANGMTTERERDQAAAQAREAKDQALQKQLSPHVLFNALNGLAELVRQDPAAAEQGLLDLADLYRRVLDHGRQQWAPLKDERLLVERYLAVEALRLGDRLHVIWDWDEALDRLMIPPLLLQPLVENAVKHGAGRRPGVFRVYITAKHALGQLEVTVENEGDLAAAGTRRGVGLTNIRQRLALYFPGESEALLETQDGWVKAGFRINERALGVKR